MHNTIIAQRYAKAVFELALEMNLLEEIKADMELISSVCADNKSFIRMLNSPVIRTDIKIKILKSVFEKEISDLSMRYLVIIT
ncbi:MAG: F0F1 ATP synthase subunit delta, partial [Bacteroidales bacterium]|nr:F0F1 ATP synthase subunit delta [Bacteroidales bacterium]